MLLPSGFNSKIEKIQGPAGEQEQAYPSESVTILLEDDFDLSRGDMIVRANNSPEVTQDIEVMLVWFDGDKPLQANGKYGLMHTTQNIRCVVKEIRYRLDINSLHREQDDVEINMNDVARVVLRTTKPIFVDAYRKNRITGSLILIDEATNNTVGACMVI
jgi:sulfate adenylyltransferase subunit 1